ncbi:slit homolog 2 protein-like isoform X2 [Amblyraja radiata]|uniref:slit homolog 2 protein-like isoform X2 n=1 Tax=Amblyraja radiata TaxID=386614 RepID=UPI001402FEF1|nr:slit homolog 2 protein-like isoform X2 [Amblyraja radiata]
MALALCLLLATLCVRQAVAGQCPRECICGQKQPVNHTEVDCYKRGLRSMPRELPGDAWVVRMGQNFLQTLPARVLQGMPHTESINFEHNTITTIHPRAFSGAGQLILVNLHGNQLSRLPRRIFQGLSRLRFLMLGQNRFTFLRPEMFAGLHNLTDLDMSLNDITSLPPNIFQALSDLRILDLAFNKIQKISGNAFTGLGLLYSLNLDHNRIQSIPLRTFKPLGSLKILVLDNNLLYTLNATALEGLGVQEVFLHNNPWSCDCRMKSFLRWLSQSEVNVFSLEMLRCSSPSWNKGKTLSSLKPVDLRCKARG